MSRMLVLLAVLSIAGCGESPEALGITGPGAATIPGVRDESPIISPGIPDQGGYGPFVGPGTPAGRYFNYN